MVQRTANIGDVVMRWEERGEGAHQVVLIHGIPTSPALWRKVLPRIVGARCLAWEMVGYGASIPQGRGRDISVSAQADYLVGWLTSLGLDRVVLVGHDLGGGVAQIAAIRHPSICAGLLLTNAIGYDSWPIPSVKAMRATGSLVRHLPDSAIKQVIRTFITRGHDDRDCAAASFGAHWSHYEATGGADAYVRQVRALDVRDTLAVADQLPRLNVPTRLVWGAADQFQKMEYGERFARDLRAPLRRIEGGKHFTPEDHPDILAEEINALLLDVGRTSPREVGSAEPSERDGHLRSAKAIIRSLAEVMPQDANPKVREIYDEIQTTLRVPFVNQVFRLLANEPAYLEAAWSYAGPIARTRAFEQAAKSLRADAALEAAPEEDATEWEELGDLRPVRRFTDSIHYVLPKLLLLTSLLDPKGKAAAAPAAQRSGAIPQGVAVGTEKIEMIDPAKAPLHVQALLEDIRDRHRHPSVATYFRSLGHWPELLEAIWNRIRPLVGNAAFEARRAALVARAAELAAELRAEAGEITEPTAPPEAADAVLAMFRERVIPDLLIDVTLVKGMLSGTEEVQRSPFDLI